VPDRDTTTPVSLEDAVDWLRKNFDPEAARGVQAVYALELTGAGGGELAARVDDGCLELVRGGAPEAELRLRLELEDFCSILAGRANPDILLMQERIGWTGDISLALKMRRLFRGQNHEPRRRPGA
jgi:hypothetical protein